MKITAALKAFLAQLGLATDKSTDDEIRSAALTAITTGKMTSEKLNELLKDGNDGKQSLADMLKAAASAGAASALATLGMGGTSGTGVPDPTKRGLNLLSGGGSGEGAGALLLGAAKSDARVTGVEELFSKSTTEARYPMIDRHGLKHPNAGQVATYNGDILMLPSQLDKAVAQAWLKWQLASVSAPGTIPKGLRFTELDKQIMEYALHEKSWSGLIGSNEEGTTGIDVKRRKLKDYERKALLDDATSGGIEIAPIEFDDALVTTPLLHGELYPLINVTDVSRGRRMKGGSVGNPTFGSTAEGTAITAFDTTALVGAFDTTIYAASASMEIGLDFEEDSPTNIGSTILDNFSQAALQWLDRVIAAGNGTSEPLGITLTSGAVSVSSDNGTGGGPTVADYEGLMFGVAKQYRNSKGGKNIFLGNEVSYRRARAIPVGALDERRVFGMTHADYMLLDNPYKIQGDLTNSTLAYANLGYYRMYKRLGLKVANETSGNYLATRNLRLIVLRMRYGGKMELGGAVAVCSDAQS